jgi:hypothetical protein
MRTVVPNTPYDTHHNCAIVQTIMERGSISFVKVTEYRRNRATLEQNLIEMQNSGYVCAVFNICITVSQHNFYILVQVELDNASRCRVFVWWMKAITIV